MGVVQPAGQTGERVWQAAAQHRPKAMVYNLNPLSPHHHHLQAGADKLPNLRVLLASNNRITAWAEVERLAGLAKLTSLLLAGNPLATEYRDRGDAASFRVEVLRRLPKLVALDGVTVEEGERRAAAKAGVVSGGGGGGV